MVIVNDHLIALKMIAIPRCFSLQCTSRFVIQNHIGRLCFLFKNVCSPRQIKPERARATG